MDFDESEYLRLTTSGRHLWTLKSVVPKTERRVLEVGGGKVESVKNL